MNKNKLIDLLENSLISAQRMHNFQKKCSSEKTLNGLFEKSKKLDRGQITVMIEVKDVPCSEVSDLVNEIVLLAVDLQYDEIPKAAYALTEQ